MTIFFPCFRNHRKGKISSYNPGKVERELDLFLMYLIVWQFPQELFFQLFHFENPENDFSIFIPTQSYIFISYFSFFFHYKNISSKKAVDKEHKFECNYKKSERKFEKLI